MAANWVVGQMARLTAELGNIDDAPVDPSVLRLKVKAPSGAVTVYAWPSAPEIVRVSIGIFTAAIPLVEAGVYAFRFESDAPLMGAAEKTLTVRKSLFAP